MLEALGFRLDLAPERIARSIDELGFGFMFAQAHHPAMKHAAPVRRELATRTVFNVLGPLTNPAGARAGIFGVATAGLMQTYAEALVKLGTRRAYVVHGFAGIDELSPAGPNQVCEVIDGEIHRARYELDPADETRLLEPLRPAADLLRGGSPADERAGAPHRGACEFSAAPRRAASSRPCC